MRWFALLGYAEKMGEPSRPAPAVRLDGAWLRRERERIAIGRRILAENLEVGEHRIATVELRTLPVPPAWCQILAVTGFRFPVGVEGSTDGAWFRRERERIAVGRRTMAAHLGVPEQAIADIELKNRRVPMSWWAAMAALGFRFPWTIEPSQPANDSSFPTEPDQPPLPTPATPSAPSAEPVQPSVPAPSPTAPAETPPPTSQRLQPRVASAAWLRAERERLGLCMEDLAVCLDIGPAWLQRVESAAHLIPKRWQPILRRLGFRREPRDTARMNDGPGPVHSGGWLMQQRQRVGLTERELCKELGVKRSSLKRVEHLDTEIPPHWLRTLSWLGILTGDLPPPAAPVAGAEDSSRSAPKAPVQIEPAYETVRNIVLSRLRLGRRTGQTAADVLAGLAEDLRQAGVERAIPYTALETALRNLLRPRRASRAA